MEENKDIIEELQNTEPAKVEPIDVQPKVVIRHDQDIVMSSLKELYAFTKDNEDMSKNLQNVVEYVEDIVALMGQYKKTAEDTSQLLYDIMLKVEKAAKSAPQDHKKKKAVAIKKASKKE